MIYMYYGNNGFNYWFPLGSTVRSLPFADIQISSALALFITRSK
jgi:hypothetical protein